MLENSAILCKKPANPDFTKELQLKAQLQQISDRSSLIKQNIKTTLIALRGHREKVGDKDHTLPLSEISYNLVPSPASS